MNNPTSKQVFAVVERFKSVLPMATRSYHLSMSCGDVNKGGHVCGTIHCVGGWYAIATGLHLHGLVDYLDGADKLARDLGFFEARYLEAWASINFKIWGNPHGQYMFGNRSAFKSLTRPDGAQNLQHIVDHWTEVGQRLQALEEAARVDVTAELSQNFTPVDERPDTATVPRNNSRYADV